MLVVLLIVVILLLLASATLMMRGGNRFSPLEFYARGKELGFSFSEAKLIKDTAVLAKIPDPTAVLWSIRELDLCIKAFTRRFKAEGKERDRAAIRFMEKLYDFRRRLEFDQPKYHVGIRSSRAVRANQKIRILVDGLGVFNSVVIDPNERYLVVSYPTGGRLPPGFQWKGLRVSVYFWRNEDAGYVFDSYVLDDLRIRNIPVLQIGHSEALLRTQKRKSLRMRSRVPAFMYLLRRLEGAYEKPERVPGMKCVLQDLSEDGAAVLIGGKAKVGLMVKLQFYFGDDQVVMSGTVKSAEYDVEKNRSVLHVEAVPPSPRMRNLIRAQVYNVRPDAADDEPPQLDGRAFSG